MNKRPRLGARKSKLAGKPEDTDGLKVPLSILWLCAEARERRQLVVYRTVPTAWWSCGEPASREPEIPNWEWDQFNRQLKRRSALRLQRGRCIRCGKTPLATTMHCEKCRRKHNLESIERYRKKHGQQRPGVLLARNEREAAHG